MAIRATIAQSPARVTLLARINLAASEATKRPMAKTIILKII
jgi:hypothetical protein